MEVSTVSRFRRRRVPKGEVAHYRRTTQRLRSVGATKTPLDEAAPAEVRKRIEQMRYGAGSSHKAQ